MDTYKAPVLALIEYYPTVLARLIGEYLGYVRSYGESTEAARKEDGEEITLKYLTGTAIDNTYQIAYYASTGVAFLRYKIQDNSINLKSDTNVFPLSTFKITGNERSVMSPNTKSAIIYNESGLYVSGYLSSGRLRIVTWPQSPLQEMKLLNPLDVQISNTFYVFKPAGKNLYICKYTGDWFELASTVDAFQIAENGVFCVYQQELYHVSPNKLLVLIADQDRTYVTSDNAPDPLPKLMCNLSNDEATFYTVDTRLKQFSLKSNIKHVQLTGSDCYVLVDENILRYNFTWEEKSVELRTTHITDVPESVNDFTVFGNERYIRYKLDERDVLLFRVREVFDDELRKKRI